MIYGCKKSACLLAYFQQSALVSLRNQNLHPPQGQSTTKETQAIWQHRATCRPRAFYGTWTHTLPWPCLKQGVPECVAGHCAGY